MAKIASTAPSFPDEENPSSTKSTPRTFHGIVQENGLTVRRLCSTLHVAAESLRAAYDEPGRLSLNAVMALSELVGEDPQTVAADLFTEIHELRKKGPAPAAPKRSRTLKPRAKSDTPEGA